jgi:hypothetical protein
MVGVTVYGTDSKGRQSVFAHQSNAASRNALAAAKELLQQGSYAVSDTCLFVDHPESSYRARDPRFAIGKQELSPPILAELSTPTEKSHVLAFLRSVNADVPLFAVNSSVANRPWQQAAEEFRNYSRSRYLILLKGSGPASSESNAGTTALVNAVLLGLSFAAAAAGGSAATPMASSKKLHASFEGVVVDLEEIRPVHYYRIIRRSALTPNTAGRMCRSVLKAMLEDVPSR